MISNILKDLGFSEKESIIYQTVYEQGHISPAQLSLSTGINRSTVYSVIKDLIDKGVVAEDQTKQQTMFVALPLSSLSSMIDKEERKIQDKKLLVEQAIKEFSGLNRTTSISEPKVTFIFEENLNDFLYKQTPEWSKSAMRRDGIQWGFQNPGFAKTYQKWIDWFWKEAADERLLLKFLTNESEDEKHIQSKGYNRRLIKYWKRGSDFTATTWVSGDYIMMVITDQKPHYLVQIYDKVLAHNMREMFKGLWESND